MRRFLPSLLLLVSLAATARGGDLTVAPDGVGADFPWIQDAIDAASPGDRILVALGNYRGFVLDKPLSIIADGSGIVRSNAFLVTGIPAGAVAVVSGIDVKRNFDDWLPSAGEECSVAVFGNAGTVVLHDLDATNGPGVAQQRGAGLRVDDTARLLVTSCVFQGISELNVDQNALDPLTGMTIESSSAWVVGSRFMAAGPAQFAGGDSGEGEPGILAVDSQLSMTGVDAIGGEGWSVELTGFGLAGGPGIRAADSWLNLAAGPSSTIEGGVGFIGQTAPGGPALELLGLTVTEVAPDVDLVGGVDGCDPSVLVLPLPCEGTGPGEAPALSVDDDATFVPKPSRLPALVLDQPSVGVGQAVELRLYGNGGHAIAIALAFALGPPFDVSFIDGTIHGNLALTFALGPALFLDGQGEASLQLTIPDVSFLHGLPLYFQALEEIGPGSFRLSDPAVFVVWN